MASLESSFEEFCWDFLDQDPALMSPQQLLAARDAFARKTGLDFHPWYCSEDIDEWELFLSMKPRPSDRFQCEIIELPKRAYAVWCPDLGRPAQCLFGWPDDLGARAARVMGFRDFDNDENRLLLSALADKHCDTRPFQISEAQYRITHEAAWVLDLDELTRWYSGEQTNDEIAIREWCAVMIRDVGVQHVMLDMLAEYGRNLTDDLVLQIHRQLDEDPIEYE